MCRPLLLLLLTVGVLTVVATGNFDVIADPFAASVQRVEKGYFDDGSLSNESTFNRVGELHGRQVHYNFDGQVILEVVYDHGIWQMHRRFDYAKGEMHTSIPTWSAPYLRTVSGPIPHEYRDYRCEEWLPSTDSD